ncbi:two-component system sensor histidine kinase CreC [Orbus hercynius]|uniref:histidine kinase n=1 Tax=Orbus hercynius TaxID=593135 RepID=A0A495RLX5_9GAMM|nr:two-component system sensor histidine kinase CreC [Orbus hercynius]RKS87808.1 two-component system sensor histidine kinase CreC [Orbus hercynius]
MRIGLQLLFGYILVAILACYLVFTIFLKEVKPTVRRVTEGMLIDTSALLATIVSQELKTLENIKNSPFGQAFKNIDKTPIQANIDGIIKTQMAYRVYITDKRGIVIFDSANLDEGKDYSRWNDVYLTLRGKYGARTTKDNPDDPTSSVMYVASPIYINGELAGVLSVSKPNQTMSLIIDKGEQRILFGGAILISVALLIGIFIIWWINRAINVLLNYAKQVSNREDTTLPKLASPELKLLANALENMRLKLDGKDYIEKYVHTLAHELKSPLSSIRAATEILQDSNDKLRQNPTKIEKINETQARFLTNIDQQTERMTILIERMLQLVRLESRVGLHFQLVNMRELIEQVVENKIIEAQSLEIELKTYQIDDTNIMGDKFLLTQALSNILSNALDFTPREGTIEISTMVADEYYMIEIKDTGTGIPEYAINRIYERFYSLPRLNKGKSSGLGLSFVKEVIVIHHGKIVIENRSDRQGTRVMLMIKIASS